MASGDGESRARSSSGSGGNRRRPKVPVHHYTIEDVINPDWTREQRANFEAALQLARENVNVAVTGVTGSGKSFLINALCGSVPRETVEYSGDGTVLKRELPAREGDRLSHESQDVEPYVAQKATIAGTLFTINIWDSPGLEDGTGKGLEYIQQLNGECEGEIDILLYCVNVSVVRCVVEDMVPGMTIVTRTLGADIWRHTMVVLTFANILEEDIIEDLSSSEKREVEDPKHVFASRINHWRQSVVLALQQAGVPEDIAQAVPAEPAGHYKTPHLPDRDHWLGYLWLKFLTHARDEAKLGILINNQHRLTNASYLTPHDIVESHTVEVPIVLKEDDVYTAVNIGASIGMSAASAAGGVAGGVAGGLLVGSFTAGLGAGFGLVAGAAVGAVVGPLIAMALAKTLQKKRMKAAKSTLSQPSQRD